MLRKVRDLTRKATGRDLAWQLIAEIQECRAELRKLALIERSELRKLALIEKDLYVDHLLNSAPYTDDKRLERHGYKVYSQHEEDGIIEEIFCRIGTSNRCFVEFGVGNGHENNTLKLLLQGWRGLWIDSDTGNIAYIQKRLIPLNYALTLRAAFITIENINYLISEWGSGDIDLLSIDIDGNDFHIWKAIDVVRPRVVVIEYNAKFRPPISIVQQYDPSQKWNGSDYFGASLEALAHLGKERGYALVGTNLAGVNAFFVRDEFGDKFAEPHSAKALYNPARYFLRSLYVSGHPPDFGYYVDYPNSD